MVWITLLTAECAIFALGFPPQDEVTSHIIHKRVDFHSVTFTKYTKHISKYTEHKPSKIEEDIYTVV